MKDSGNGFFCQKQFAEAVSSYKQALSFVHPEHFKFCPEDLID